MTVYPDENSPQFEEEIVLLDLSLPLEDRAELDRSTFAALNLDCIGLNCTLQLLV
jgi:hypothetical protein